MLVLGGVAQVHCDGAAVDVQLAHDGAGARQAPQAQQADQDVLPHVLVRQEGLPAAVGCVLPPHQLNLLGRRLAMDVLPAARQAVNKSRGKRMRFLLHASVRIGVLPLAMYSPVTSSSP